LAVSRGLATASGCVSGTSKFGYRLGDGNS